MRLRTSVLGFACCLAFCSSTLAGDRIGIGVKAGTLGIGVDVTGRLTSWLSVRGSASGFEITEDIDESDIEYEADLEVGAYGILIDLHPFKGDFRLTAGLMENKNRIDLTARATDDLEIGNTTYTPAQVGTLTGEATFEERVSYFGIGFGNAARGPGRLRLVLDLGVLMQGSADVELATTSAQVSAVDFEIEESELEEDAADYEFWPVLAIGFSLRI